MQNISTPFISDAKPKKTPDPSAPSLPNLSNLMDEEQEIGILHAHTHIHIHLYTSKYHYLHTHTTYMCKGIRVCARARINSLIKRFFYFMLVCACVGVYLYRVRL